MIKARFAALTPRRRLLLASAMASFAIAAGSLADAKGLRRLSLLRADIQRQEQKNHDLREANARLRKTVESLSPPIDPAALEKAAREQLGFVRKDELLFKFE